MAGAGGERKIFGLFRIGSESQGQRLLAWPESRRTPQDLIETIDLPPGVEDGLEDHQKKILANLVNAATGFAAVFAAQDAAEELSFYPAGATREQIIEADEKNPDANIRSPYTVVEIDSNGNWLAKPMHQVYAQLIKENRVREYLRQAASSATKGSDKDQTLRIFLIARDKAFETGEYKQSEEFWITSDIEPKVSIEIGFHDAYHDPLMGEKFAAQAWVDILDEQRTEIARGHVKTFQRWRKQKTHKPTELVRVRAGYPKVMTGQAALYDWSANSYPCQEEWRQEMGSKIHLFLTQFEKNVRRRRPVMEQLGRLYDIPDQKIQDLAFQQIVYHEAAHSEVSVGIKRRLGRLAQPVKELYCDLLALEAINDTSTEQYTKDIALLSIFADGLLGYVDYLAQRKRAEYYVGTSTILSYCVENGSVNVNEYGIIWDDTERVFEDISQLAKKVKTVQSRGTLNSAQRFFDSHFHPDIYSVLVRLANTSPQFLLEEGETTVATL